MKENKKYYLIAKGGKHFLTLENGEELEGQYVCRVSSSVVGLPVAEVRIRVNEYDVANKFNGESLTYKGVELCDVFSLSAYPSKDTRVVVIVVPVTLCDTSALPTLDNHAKK